MDRNETEMRPEWTGMDRNYIYFIKLTDVSDWFSKSILSFFLHVRLFFFQNKTLRSRNLVRHRKKVIKNLDT